MELASVPLKSNYVVWPVPGTAPSRNRPPSRPAFRSTHAKISSLFWGSKSSGFLFTSEKIKLRQSFLVSGVKLRQSFLVSGVLHTNAATDESIPKHKALCTGTRPLAVVGAVEENDKFLENKDIAGEQLEDEKMVRICDKLIQVFMIDKPTPTDWRRLLIFSKEWDSIGPNFYKRCQNRAESESDPGMKHQLLRLARKLKEIDQDIQRHNELLGAVRKSPSEVGEIVARRRKDFTKEFFVHLHTVAESYYDNPTEQNAVAKLGNTCLAAVEAYDTASESIEALNAAELKFQDIINSPTVDAACRKIDNLAEKNQLDSALVLMITKAWSAAKESSMVKDEAKDVLYHLYKTARGNLQRLMPKEIRILKYLLTIKDPEERMSALKDAFIPGDELQGVDVDLLYTTPEQLHTWIRTVIDAYHFSREGTLVREARDLMNPAMIQKLEDLKKTIQDNFM